MTDAEASQTVAGGRRFLATTGIEDIKKCIDPGRGRRGRNEEPVFLACAETASGLEKTAQTEVSVPHKRECPELTTP
jgi:hypothetical protein